jgi:hypothetical protein
MRVHGQVITTVKATKARKISNSRISGRLANAKALVGVPGKYLDSFAFIYRANRQDFGAE